jgi:uncharacterized cupredoxin-like copper-binding protein
MNSLRTFSFAWLLMAMVTISSVQAHDDHGTASKSFGQPGAAARVSHTVAITLTDAMHFSPASLSFRQGETVRLHIVNAGKLPHEFVLGTHDEIVEHAALMRQMPNMVHTDAGSVRVAPGRSADLVWQFSVAGTFLYACLVPGHWEAGMQGHVTVAAPVKKRA